MIYSARLKIDSCPEVLDMLEEVPTVPSALGRTPQSPGLHWISCLNIQLMAPDQVIVS